MRILYKGNYSGLGQIMKSEGVQGDLVRRGQAIAAAAGDGFEVDSHVGSTRARTMVYADTSEAIREEQTNKVLTRAFGAGRG